MHRFYLAPGNWNPDALRLTGPEAHHARNVLRLQPGDKAVLFNGRGREITAEVTAIDAHEVSLRKLHEAGTPPLRCRITLAQAIPKGKHMELIVQKAVEIGAAEIVPIISDRTVVRLDPDDAAQKQAKWQTVAIEAAKQCGQNWLPAVETPRTLAQFFSPVAAGVSPASSRGMQPARLPLQERGMQPARLPLQERGMQPARLPLQERGMQPARLPRQEAQNSFDLRLIGSLQSDAFHLKDVLSEYATEHGRRPASVLMMIGPEGDFTPAELNLARSRGCRPITLGPIILRVETAAIYCLSVLSYELL